MDSKLYSWLQAAGSHPFWILFTTIILLSVIKFAIRNFKLPKGPYGLPFIGYILFIERGKLSQNAAELCRKYNTDIICLTAWGTPMVILNSYELLKEVFQKRLDVQDRTPASLFRSIDETFTGIISTSGTMWKEIRRFSLSTLRDFGMGRVGAEENIQSESRVLQQHFKAHNGEAFDPKEYMNMAVSNIICGMVFGKRFDHDDADFKAALKGMNDMFGRFKSRLVFLSIRWKVARDHFFQNTWKLVVGDYMKMAKFVDKQIQEHKENYNGEVTDLIYGYMKEMAEERHPEVFNESMLRSLIFDYFLAGSETTYSTLRWCVLIMAAYPDVQRRVQEELDQVVGDREPCMSDKKSTPYSEAVLCEVQRHYTLVPMGLAHTNRDEDIEIKGYTIPKNSSIFANLHEIHHDRNFWKNPDEFDPENFLEDGRVVNLDRLVPFSIGRRACAGEALARMELYLFFTSIVKHFTIRLEQDDTVPDLEGSSIALRQPKPFKVRMISRD